MIDRGASGPGRDYFFVISRVFQQGGDCTELCRWLETKTLSSTHREKGRKREGGWGRDREGCGGRLEARPPTPSGEEKESGARRRGGVEGRAALEGKILYLNEIM